MVTTPYGAFEERQPWWRSGVLSYSGARVSGMVEEQATYIIVDVTTDQVVEAASSGTDTVQSYINYTLGSSRKT